MTDIAESASAVATPVTMYQAPAGSVTRRIASPRPAGVRDPGDGDFPDDIVRIARTTE